VPSKVVTDVSIIGPKVVLIQEIIPIGFENQNISFVERNYTTREQ
jgi:hypothetical protein